MTTNYSFQNLVSDLSSTLSEISKNSSFNPAITKRLNTAKAWAEERQHEKPVGSLHTKYEELAKQYLSELNSPTLKGDKVGTTVYLLKLIQIGMTVNTFGGEYKNILEHGVNVLEQYKERELKEICREMLNNKGKYEKKFEERGYNFDSAKKYLEEILRV